MTVVLKRFYFLTNSIDGPVGNTCPHAIWKPLAMHAIWKPLAMQATLLSDNSAASRYGDTASYRARGKLQLYFRVTGAENQLQWAIVCRCLAG